MIPGLVSVIIPTYNRPDYLREAVESVFAQTYPAIEILIIDDGSADGGAIRTKSALKPYLSGESPDLPKLPICIRKTPDWSPAVNRGLTLAQGEYIQRLDDDDRLLPEKIARSVELFQAHPEVGLVATGYYHIDAAGKRIRTRIHPVDARIPERLFNMLMGCISACAGVMVRSLVHQRVGAYIEISKHKIMRCGFGLQRNLRLKQSISRSQSIDNIRGVPSTSKIIMRRWNGISLTSPANR